MNDPYQVLGVNRDASEEEIKKAYRKAVLLTHPDRCPGDKDAEDKFKEIQSAFDILSDPIKRADYNQFGTASARRPSHDPFSHMWADFFGGSSNKGRDVQIRVDLTLEEVSSGVRKTVRFETRKTCETCESRGYTEWDACKTCSGSGRAFLKQSPFNIFMTCPDCRGTGRNGTVQCQNCHGAGLTSTGEKVLDVDIPAGIDNGMQVMVRGEGEPSSNGGKPGDLFIIVAVETHKVFVRKGVDLVVEILVSYTEFVFGSEVTVPTLGGADINFHIPAGSQANTKFRIRGCGLPILQGAGKGDLIVLAKLDIPSVIDEDYKMLLNQLREKEQQCKSI